MTVAERGQEPVFGERTRWTVDPDRIEVRFSVGLMKAATVDGRFGRVKGTFLLDNGAPHRSRADLAIEAASIDTRNPVRDFHLRTRDYLDAGRFPYIAFASTHVAALDDTTHQVTGELTIRGFTREISLSVAHDKDIVELGSRRRRFSAETKIYRRDFGVDPGVSGFGFLIGNEITVRVRGEATEQPRSDVDLREVL